MNEYVIEAVLTFPATDFFSAEKILSEVAEELNNKNPDYLWVSMFTDPKDVRSSFWESTLHVSVWDITAGDANQVFFDYFSKLEDFPNYTLHIKEIHKKESCHGLH